MDAIGLWMRPNKLDMSVFFNGCLFTLERGSPCPPVLFANLHCLHSIPAQGRDDLQKAGMTFKRLG